MLLTLNAQTFLVTGLQDAHEERGIVQDQCSTLCHNGVGARASYWVVFVFLLYLNSLVFTFITLVNRNPGRSTFAVWFFSFHILFQHSCIYFGLVNDLYNFCCA